MEDEVKKEEVQKEGAFIVSLKRNNKKIRYIRFIRNQNLVITCLDHIKHLWDFVYKGQIIHCSNEKVFIKGIANILKIDKVYVSRSIVQDIKEEKI